MGYIKNNAPSSGISYWQVLRFVFVLFSFYLLFDALYRWNGFSYYSTFSEFLPGVALITILWSILSAFTAILLWFPLRTIELISLQSRWRKIDRLLLFLYTLSFLTAIAVIGIKNFVGMGLSYQMKSAVFSGVVLITILMVFAIERFSIRSARNNIGYWLRFLYAFVLTGTIIWIGNNLIWHKLSVSFQIPIIICIILISIALVYSDKAWCWIQDRITIWTWLFSLWLILSVPLVAYYAWFNKPYNKVYIEKVDQSTGAYKNRPNIILVTFDELTSIHMSAYGYHRDTTPFISKWAKEASLFSRAKASSPATAQSTASLMTGKRLWNHRIFQNHSYKIYKGENENIPRLLKQNGYYNMAYLSSKYNTPHGSNIKSFFDIYRSPTNFRKNLNFCIRIHHGLYKMFGENIRLYDWILRVDFILPNFLKLVNRSLLGDPVLAYCDVDFFYDTKMQFNKILEDIDNNTPEPFFAWIHLFSTHEPYLPPESYKGMYMPDNGTQYDNEYYDIATYDAYIRYIDDIFKEFIEDQRLRNIMNNTVIILSSDHGKHRNPDMSEKRINIPLIIKERDRKEGHMINDLVEQVDIPATIIDLAQIPKPGWIEGRSLVPLMLGKQTPPKPALSMHFDTNPAWDQITRGTIAVWDGDYKLIHNLETGKSTLFNIKEDPDELNDLFDNKPEIGQHLLAVVLKNFKEANERFAGERGKFGKSDFY